MNCGNAGYERAKVSIDENESAFFSQYDSSMIAFSVSFGKK